MAHTPDGVSVARPRRALLAPILLGTLAIALAHLLDPIAFRYVRVDNVYGEDWGRLLRIVGFLPTWLVAGAALLLQDRTRARLPRARGGLLIAGATLGGMATELVKLLVRRLRPRELGEYVFRPFTDRPFSTGGLAMPSSHAGVAFGAAAVLARLFPGARFIWWGLAAGCALTRVAAGAHFLSDVVAAGVIGWGVGALVWRWREPAPLESPPVSHPS
jgi:membrane-associated phospholipid phosphatase